MIATRRGAFLVEQSGPAAGPAIVLVAGLGDDHRSGADPAAILARSYRVITFDNRGIGGSPITPGPYSIAELAEDVHELVSEIRIGRVSAAGSSMGCAIFQECALAYPDDVDRLVLSNTWAERDRWFSGLIEHWIELA